MSKATIYRVEAHDGRGPYQGIPSLVDKAMTFDGLELNYQVGPHVPPPHMDKELMTERSRSQRMRSTYFGFCTIDQYKAWFKESLFRKALALLGGRLVEYEVDDDLVVHGSTQCIFDIRRAKPVKTVSPDSLD